MRAALYSRVSSGAQVRTGYSLDDQDERGRGFIAQRGWTLDERHVYVDAGVSSKKESRPGLDSLIRAVSNGEVDVIVGGDIDRIGRTMMHTYELMGDWHMAGVEVWHADGRSFSMGDSIGRMNVRTLLSMAEWERDLMGDRSLRAVPRKRSNGHYNGGFIPYGLVRTDKPGILAPDPERAHTVRSVYSWYVDGLMSFRGIADRLNSDGIIPGRGGPMAALRRC